MSQQEYGPDITLDLADWQNTVFWTWNPKIGVRLLAVDLSNGKGRPPRLVGALQFHGDKLVGDYEVAAVWERDGTFVRMMSITEHLSNLPYGAHGWNLVRG